VKLLGAPQIDRSSKKSQQINAIAKTALYIHLYLPSNGSIEEKIHKYKNKQ